MRRNRVIRIPLSSASYEALRYHVSPSLSPPLSYYLSLSPAPLVFRSLFHLRLPVRFALFSPCDRPFPLLPLHRPLSSPSSFSTLIFSTLLLLRFLFLFFLCKEEVEGEGL